MAISNADEGAIVYSVESGLGAGAGAARSPNVGALRGLRAGALFGRVTGAIVPLMGVSPSASILTPITSFGYRNGVWAGFARVSTTGTGVPSDG